MDMSVTPTYTGRLKLLLIFGLFLLPLVSATLWYKLLPVDYKPNSMINHGQLLEPIYTLQPFSQPTLQGRTFTEQNLRQHWTLVYRLNRPCDKACNKVLYNTRQIRTALGKDQQRVQRLIIVNQDNMASPDQALLTSHADLVVLQAATQGLEQQIRAHTPLQPQSDDAVYLLDPLGNLIMQFSPALPPKQMLQDLQKLLRLSHIG